MSTKKNVRTDNTLRITFVGLMTAIVFVSNYIRIPFMDTQLTVANSLCAISGVLFGPFLGFTAAGLGSLIYDLMTSYASECLITFCTKGCIGLLAGLIAYHTAHKEGDYIAKDIIHIVIGCAAGAFTYVCLYMLKTYIFGICINGLDLNGTLVKMGMKLPGSLINATFATIVAPILFLGLKQPLKKSGILSKM